MQFTNIWYQVKIIKYMTFFPKKDNEDGYNGRNRNINLIQLFGISHIPEKPSSVIWSSLDTSQ